MSEPLDPKSPLVDSLRERLILGLDRCLELLSDSATTDPDDIVHDVRKLTKVLRAQLRLLRPVMRRSVWRAEMTALRDAAAQLAAKRDAHVLLATFDQLATSLKEPGALNPVREALAARAAAHAADSSLSQAAEILQGVRERAGTWAMKGQDRVVIEKGLRQLYAKCRERMFRARTEGGTKNFHAWRRSNKQLMHAVELLAGSWPEAQGAWIHRAHAVSDDLGLDHDLMDVRSEIQALPEEIATTAASALGLVAQRSGELRSRSLGPGAALMADRPRAFARRQMVWWDKAER